MNYNVGDIVMFTKDILEPFPVAKGNRGRIRYIETSNTTGVKTYSIECLGEYFENLTENDITQYQEIRLPQSFKGGYNA